MSLLLTPPCAFTKTHTKNPPPGSEASSEFQCGRRMLHLVFFVFRFLLKQANCVVLGASSLVAARDCGNRWSLEDRGSAGGLAQSLTYTIPSPLRLHCFCSCKVAQAFILLFTEHLSPLTVARRRNRTFHCSAWFSPYCQSESHKLISPVEKKNNHYLQHPLSLATSD